MLYHSITKDDMLNGEGLRVVLWVAGCEHRCPECQNPQTWDPDKGEPFDHWAMGELMDLVRMPHIDGITFSGGDPLHPANRDAVGVIAQKVKSIGNKDVWLYTGYDLIFEDGKPVFEDTVIGKRLTADDVPWLENVDVLVDGRFDAAIRKQDIRKGSDPDWRGSSNQRIIDVKASLQKGEVVLYLE